MYRRMIDTAVKIQQIPAPSFEEAQRAAYIRDLLAAEGLQDVQRDDAGNILARLPGSGEGKPLVVSAHMDTVFPADTPLETRVEGGRLYGPGIGDNSLGVAGLFGLVWWLRECGAQLKGDVWLAANTCEEGLGDLRGMRAVVDRFGAQPAAYLVLEGMALGHIYHKGICVQRYRISVHTQGGHSWTDFGRPSAVHELAKLAAKIAEINVPAHPHTTYNVGRVSGGTSINTIASEAWMELDLRSEQQGTLNWLIGQAQDVARAQVRDGVDVRMEMIGQRPGGEVPVNHPVIQLGISCLRGVGMDPILTSGSTDANVPFSRGYAALVLGFTHGGGAHTTGEYIETAPVEQGLEHVGRFVSRFWD